MLRHIPNSLCVLRMLLAAPIAWSLFKGQIGTTTWLVLVAAATDALDGFLAKRFNWTSQLGKILDPLADKILLVTTFISLTCLNYVPIWLAIVVVTRDLIITFGAITYQNLFGPLTDAKPTIISKINTLMQIAYVVCVIASLKYHSELTVWKTVLTTIVLVTTIASGIDYIATYIQLAIRHNRRMDRDVGSMEPNDGRERDG